MPDELKPSQTPTTSSSPNAQIFTMPEAYRHGKEVKLVEPIKEKKQAPLVPTAPPPVPPKPMASPMKPSPKHTQKALIISGAAVLIALLIGAYLVFRSAQKQTPVPAQPEPVVEQPAPRPETQTPTVEVPKEESEETQNPFAQEIVPGKDSDSDGLTDTEELTIYKTDPNLPDTDSDGFLDGNEVFHRYNPSGIAPGTLLEAGLVKTFVSAEAVSFLFPSLWTSETLALPDPSVPVQPPQSLTRFKATTEEMIDVGIYAAQAAEQSQALLFSWIESQGGQEQVIKTRTKNGNELYISRDQLDAFLLLKDRPIIFTYVVGTKGTIEYLQTFQMILNSL